MDILIISQYYAPEPLPKVAELASTLIQKGHRVTVITGFPNYPYGKTYEGYKLRWRSLENLEGVRVIRVPLYPDHSRSKVRRFLNYGSFAISAMIAGIFVKRHDCMIVFHPPLSMGIVAAVVARIKRVRYIYCMSDLWPDLMIASGVVRSNVLIRLLTSVEKFVYKRADILAPVSEGMKKRLREKGVPLEKLTVLPDWADESLFKPVSPDLNFANRYRLHDRFTIMFAGQLGVAQDLDTFIQAMGILGADSEVCAVIVGDGLEKGRLEAKVQELGLGNVYFVGRLPQEAMPSMYATADVMLVELSADSSFAMSVPGKVYGYMACGRPILGAVVGATADIISEADCGLICIPGNAEDMAVRIREFARIPKTEREQMGLRGRQEFLATYSRSHTVAKYEFILRDLA